MLMSCDVMTERIQTEMSIVDWLMGDLSCGCRRGAFCTVLRKVGFATSTVQNTILATDTSTLMSGVTQAQLDLIEGWETFGDRNKCH